MADHGYDVKPYGSTENLPNSEPMSEHGVTQDEQDLARWGKRQQLRRNFGLLSIISLTCTLMITWEGLLTVFAGGLTNGGPAGLIYGFILVWIGCLLQALVMAEMGSMMPIAGGQYNWVSILAPPSTSKFLSYITGWITLLSWQVTVASASFLGAGMIQGLLILSHSDYVPERWQATLIFYAILLLSVFINTVLVRILPHIESLIFIIHVLGFFGILIPLVYFAPKNYTAHDVFTTFTNAGGWSTDGLSFFVGISASIFAFIGLDAAGHMAEEITTATAVIPKSMVLSVMINGALGFAMLIAVLFCMGDENQALQTPTGFPYLWIFQNALNSVNGTIAMASVIIVAMIFAVVGILATGSRMLWAFARERGVPFSHYIAMVHTSAALPLYSLGVSFVISALLALLNIASTAAFNAFVSLTVGGFYSSYFIAGSCLLYKRLVTPIDQLQFGPFHLGRWGVPIIILSLAYTMIGIFFSFFPASPNPTPDTMNWSILLFGAAMLFSLFYWAVWGRKVYTGPIMEITMPPSHRD